jgi:RimJ/RimL family protein N-acetyltransferase
MLRELAVMADALGVTRLTAVCFADNTPLIELLRSTGASRETSGPDGTSTAELDVQEWVGAATLRQRRTKVPVVGG